MLAEQKVLDDVLKEYNRAVMSYGEFNSAHEGYAVILEELDELWDEIRKSHKTDGNHLMQKEAVQVAAMAVRFIVDICMDEHGNYYK